MIENNDYFLLEKIKNSDFEAFRTIFHKYHSFLFRYVYYQIKNDVLSQDISQETFLKVWLNRSKINPHASFSAFIIKIGTNIIRDHIKREKVREKYKTEISTSSESFMDNPESALELNQLQNEINEIVNKNLPNKCRTIFIMSRFEGKSNQEIAELLDITKKTVENQLYHALKILRKKLEKFL